MYILKIRIGESFYPVNWELGGLATDTHPPTLFSSKGRLEAEEEIRSVGKGNYIFEHIENENLPRQDQEGASLTLLKFPKSKDTITN